MTFVICRVYIRHFPRQDGYDNICTKNVIRESLKDCPDRESGRAYVTDAGQIRRQI